MLKVDTQRSLNISTKIYSFILREVKYKGVGRVA